MIANHDQEIEKRYHPENFEFTDGRKLDSKKYKVTKIKDKDGIGQLVEKRK